MASQPGDKGQAHVGIVLCCLGRGMPCRLDSWSILDQISVELTPQQSH